MVSLDLLREGPIQARLIELLRAQTWARGHSLIFWACMSMLVASLLFGGGTKAGFLSDVVLELVAIPAFLIALTSLIDLPLKASTSGTRWALLLCLSIGIMPLLQLVPLPSWIWTRLPSRENVEAVFNLLGGYLPWMPISVLSNATWVSFLSLLAPMAIFLAVVQLSYLERRQLTMVIVAMGVISSFIGLMQVAQGPSSPLRFFAFTNTMEAVGFFANRNHFAALLYSALPFAAAWAIDVAFKSGSWADLKRFAAKTVVVLAACSIVLIVLIAGETVARSRAGLFLTIVALAGAFALVFTDRRSASSGVTPSKLLVGVVLLAATFAVQFALYRILDRFAVDPMEDARIPFAHNTIRAAIAFMPFGSGLGTFVPVYEMFEPPSDVLANTYANHAHNDFIELWLETGVIGVGLLVLFVIWMGFRFVNAWWRVPSHASPLDCSLVRAATIVIALLLAHSFVDYPLRTGTMMAVVAFSCGLLTEPIWSRGSTANRVQVSGLESTSLEKSVSSEPSTVLSSPRLPPISNRAGPPNPSSRQPAGLWGEGLEWPQEWSKNESDVPTGFPRGPEKPQK
jgi:O-antigen ligase